MPIASLSGYSHLPNVTLIHLLRQFRRCDLREIARDHDLAEGKSKMDVINNLIANRNLLTVKVEVTIQ